MKLAVVEDGLPQASVAVKVTEAVPVEPQSSLNPSKLLVQVTSEHVSLETAPPLEANHAAKASWFPWPSHSTVAFEACVEIVGLVVSTIVKLAVVEDGLPQASVAVKVTDAVPVWPQPSLRAV